VDVAKPASVGASPRARELLRALVAERGPLVLLLDDSGCCGPGNVFVQVERPRPSYRWVATVERAEVFIAPSFLQEADPSAIVLDVRPAPLDDSLSLETARGVRLTVEFGRPEPPTRAYSSAEAATGGGT
jgi:uncharacterized protein (DUF779 family)